MTVRKENLLFFSIYFQSKCFEWFKLGAQTGTEPVPCWWKRDKKDFVYPLLLKYTEEHDTQFQKWHADLSVFHPNPRVTLLWPQILPVESSLLQDPAISGFVGQSGDMLMAHRHRRGYRPLHPPVPRTQLTAGNVDS